MTLDTSFTFETRHLAPLAGSIEHEYRAAEPFPHVVIDDFLPEHVLEGILAEFPTPGESAWWRFESERERKLGTGDDSLMGPLTRELFAQFNGATFIDFLRDLTGMTGLVPDPHLFGGGLHQIEAGGFLDVHADFNLHPTTKLERRLNLLLYLNRDWQEAWHGALELWDRDMSHCEKSITPIFNRCVIFSTTDTSFHGHPEPLTCPAGTTRKSLALYYYSLPTSARIEQMHNTVFPRDPTLPVDGGNGPSPWPNAATVRRWATELLPPVVTRSVRRVRTTARARRDRARSTDRR